MIKGKVVIVTGASRGIGIEISLSLIRQGAIVVLAARSTHEIEERLKDIKGDYLIHNTDIEDFESVKYLVSSVIKKYNRIDVLINNAGYVEPKSLFETTLENWNKTIAVNLTGAFLSTKEVSRYMKKTGGRIINRQDN